jgi:TPR repeat protein
MRRITATLAVVLAILLSAGSAWADFDDGLAAYKRGDFVTAAEEWRPYAEQGDAAAQTVMGTMYYEGRGVPVNYTGALKWFLKAAEQGYGKAQFQLGVMYANGEGVPKNDAQAFNWYSKAAEQGNADAQNNLGVMYAMGKGVPKNDVRAYMWLSLAKAQGDKEAAGNLDIVKKRMTSADISKAQALWEKLNN